MGLDVTGRYRYPSPVASWLGRHVEAVIEPSLAVVDAHHHLWIENDSPYLLDEIAADVADGHRIDATVFVQAHYGYDQDAPAHLAPIGETRKVAAIAAQARARDMATRIAAGIVGFVDLTLGDLVDDALDAHAAAADGTFCGVRHSVSNDPAFPNGIVIRPAPAHLLGDVRYRAGLAKVAARGLSYDAMLYQVQIPELTAMARALPDLTIVLDHIGCILGVGPYKGRTDETFAAWRRDMTALATCPNVVVKLGGFGMIVTGADWHERPEPPNSIELADAWRPYVETCIDLFGADRCMFESNFPVDKAMYSYRTLWNAFKRLASDASAAEKAALFAGTAASTYRLAIPFARPRTEMNNG
uniref:amidohydrolase family protein n=1 Tax=uncultured Sphingomonas sp. TaxID=158754 RepID=UPI0035CC31A8